MVSATPVKFPCGKKESVLPMKMVEYSTPTGRVSVKITL